MQTGRLNLPNVPPIATHGQTIKKINHAKYRPSCLQMIFHKMIQQLGMIYSQQSPMSQYNNATMQALT